VREGLAELGLPDTDVGDIVDLSLLRPDGVEHRLAYHGPEDLSRSPLRVYGTANGSLSVKHERRQPPALPSANPVRHARRVLGRLRQR
jgi:hypothetical protein